MFALLEVVLVSWLYGVDTFLDNMAEMGIRLSKPTRWEEQQPTINLLKIAVKTLLASVLAVHHPGCAGAPAGRLRGAGRGGGRGWLAPPPPHHRHPPPTAGPSRSGGGARSKLGRGVETSAGLGSQHPPQPGTW